MSAQSGWYPDPGGTPNLYRYWDGKAWSAVTSPNPGAPAPSIGLVDSSQDIPAAQQANAAYGSGQQYGQQSYGQQSQYGSSSAYANYQQVQQKKSPVGWWIAAAALVVVLVIIGVFAVRAVTGGGGTAGGTGGQGSQNSCPEPASDQASPFQHPSDGRVHGGPMSYPQLGSPWSSPSYDNRVPFGVDTQTQTVEVEPNYQPGKAWVASVLVAQLQAGDGFFTPEQGAQVVVRCILGQFYGDNPVQSNVTVNKAMKIDGQDGWLVESKLSFNVPNLQTKGELLIVAIAASGADAGLFYASIPDTSPQLVAPARQALSQLQVDS